MTNKRGLQRQTATPFPGLGRRLLQLVAATGSPRQVGTWFCFALGSSFLDGRLGSQRALGQSPCLRPEVLSQAFPTEYPVLTEKKF